MIKKLFGLFALFMFMFVVVFFTGAYTVYPVGSSTAEPYMFRSGYLSGQENQVLLFKSFGELSAYYLENREKYAFDMDRSAYRDYEIKNFKAHILQFDSQWFSAHMLAIYVSIESSGSYRYSLKNIDYKEGVADIYLYKLAPRYGTADMAGWHTFIELERREGIDSAEVHVTVKSV